MSYEITAHMIELRLEILALREQVIQLTSELLMAKAHAVIDAARPNRDVLNAIYVGTFGGAA